jgi:transcriptional regulator with XRE-family HTH domain
MDDLRLGSVVRAVRKRRGLSQTDLATLSGVGHSTVSLVERGHCETLSLRTLRSIAAALDVRVELLGRWRAGDLDRLLSRRHSLLAERVASFMSTQPGWISEPEVSFGIYGERGVIDRLAWHAATGHLLVIELKTEFVDVNEMLGTLDRKARLARSIAAARGWRAASVSAWVVASATRTNRRHAAQHAALLSDRLRMDGRQLRPFLRNPTGPTTGLAFWTDSNPRGESPEDGHYPARVKRSVAPEFGRAAADIRRRA